MDDALFLSHHFFIVGNHRILFLANNAPFFVVQSVLKLVNLLSSSVEVRTVFYKKVLLVVVRGYFPLQLLHLGFKVFQFRG
jgi:hypothetical protein